MEEIVLVAIMMYLFREGSCNRMNEDREEEQFRQNYKSLLGLRLLYLDKVSDVMKQLDTEYLEELRKHVVNYLLNKRTVHRFRLLKQYFMIAIDGSGVYTYDHEPYRSCPYKENKHGKKTWYQNV
ncbi:MAG: hypothetical protein ACI86M_003616 [Saprospiraceae bacterium]|jgi:hypothetical protein